MKTAINNILFLLVLSVSLSQVGCKKNNLWPSNLTVTTAIWDTTFHDWREHKISGLKIKLSKNEEYQEEYIISDTTDIHGEVQFELIPEAFRNDEGFNLLFEGKIDDTYFKGTESISPEQKVANLNIVLANQNSNMLSVTTFDSSGKELIPHVTIYIYTSKLLADSMAKDYSYASAVGNLDAKSDFRGVKPGNYYLSAMAKVGKDSLKRISKPIYIPENQLVIKDSIWLQ